MEQRTLIILLKCSNVLKCKKETLLVFGSNLLIEYCVGSSEDEPDDVVECIPVASNSSGSVSIADGGSITVTTESEEAKLNMTEFPRQSDLNQTIENTQGRGDFNLEPGK